MKKIVPLVVMAFILAGSIFSSCKKDPVSPKPCDTCSKPCDTCTKPCDTCNINKDSLSHAFTWKEYAIPSESNLTGVWVFGPNDIIIVGGNLWHFDGTTFTDLHPIRNGSNTPLDGALSGFTMFAFSPTDYWLVHGSIALHTSDGQHFDDNRKGAVNACWGTSSSDMYFVGNGGHIFHYDGTAFTEMASGTTKDIRKIWGTSDNNIWASGWNQTTGESVLLHYNGSWSEVVLSRLGNIGPGSHGLVGTWTCDSIGHNIAVACGSFVYRTTDDGVWYTDTLRNGLGGGAYASLNNVRGNSSADFMVQGGGGFLSHWNGKTWFLYDKLFNWEDPGYDINAFSFVGNIACMVGYKDGQGYVAVGTRKQ